MLDFSLERNKLKRNIPVKEYNDAFIIPGLIDTHIHGAVGHDTMDSTPEALKSIGDYLLTQGTTTLDANYSNKLHLKISIKLLPM